MQKIICILFLCLTLFGAIPNSCFCAAQSAQVFVKEFYEWYFVEDYYISAALKQEKIEKYVDKKTLEYVSKHVDCSEINYFTQVGGYFIGYKNASVAVGDVLSMIDGVYVVPVTFSKEGLHTTVIVFIKKDEDTFKITKVANIYPY